MTNNTPDFLEEYNRIVSLGGDPRTKGWPLVDTFYYPACIIGTYVAACVMGPIYMKNRKAVQLGHWLTAYNLALVVLSFYMAFEILVTAIRSGYSVGCQPVDYTNNPLALRMASGLWVFYISKYAETLDTIIFIVRKKNSQITFLHVFHHATMIINDYFCTKYIPGGASFFHAVINSTVHIIMYTYYGLSAIPAARPYLWWKRYLTKIQLVQFVCIFAHTLYSSRYCDFPIMFIYLSGGYCVVMLVLFGNFYYQEYFKRAKLRAQGLQKKSDGDNSLSTVAAKNGTHNGSQNGTHNDTAKAGQNGYSTGHQVAFKRPTKIMY